MGRGAWWAAVRGVAQSRTRLSDWAQHTQQGKWEGKLNGGTSDRCAVIKRRLTRSSRVCKPGLQRHPVASRNGRALTSVSHWQETSTEKCSLLANLAMDVRAQQMEPLVHYSPCSWRCVKFILTAATRESSRPPDHVLTWHLCRKRRKVIRLSR